MHNVLRDTGNSVKEAHRARKLLTGQPVETIKKKLETDGQIAHLKEVSSYVIRTSMPCGHNGQNGHN